MSLTQKVTKGVVIPAGAVPSPGRYIAGLESYLKLPKSLATQDIALAPYCEDATKQHYCGLRSGAEPKDTLELYALTSLSRATIATISFFGPNQRQYKLLLSPISTVTSKTVGELSAIASIVTKLILHPLFPQLRLEAVLTPVQRMKLVKGGQWITLPTVGVSSLMPYVLFSELLIVDNPEVLPKYGRLLSSMTPRWNTRVIPRQQQPDTPVIRISKLAAVIPKEVRPSAEKTFNPDEGISSVEL